MDPATGNQREEEPSMSSRSSGPVTRVVVTLAASAAVVAASILQPLAAASAQTAPTPHISVPVNSGPPSSRPHQWSAADALNSLRRPPAVNAAAVRQQALTHATATEKTASYRVSPATLALLSHGFGMPLGSSTLLTGIRSGGDLKISLPAPALGLPAGVRQPKFGRSVLLIDRATGAATLTAGSPDGGLRITIPDAAAASVTISGELSLRVPVLGQTASLSGQVGYAGSHTTVSLTGHLPASATLQRDVASLGAGAAVTLSTAGGLHVSGTALLGSPGRQLGVPVTGTTAGTGDWTFTVRPGAVTAAPLPGLALSPDADGAVISKHGLVSFDVSVPTARPWSPLHGVTVSGTATFSNKVPNGALIPAPGIAARTPWLDVSGTVSVASVQAGPVSTHGSAAINLASGKGLLTGSGTTPVVLATAPHRLVLDQVGFRGQLALDKSGVTGSVRGTGRVTLTGKGRNVTTETTLSVTPSGTIAASVPTAASVLAQAAPAGRAAGVPAASAAARTASPAATSASASADSTTYPLSTPVFDFITKTLNIPLGSATLTGTLSGSTLTVTAAAPTALPSSLPSWLPDPSYVSTQLSVDESTGTLTVSAATGTTGGQTATLTVTIASASTSDLSSGTDVTGSLVLDGVPFVGGSHASLDFTLGYSDGALSASLSGTTADTASFANGLITIPAGATLTLATGSGLSLDGTADINSGSNSAQIMVSGMLSSLSDWSLTVSDDAGALEWYPASGLSVTPDFSGSITDTAGAIGFDLATAGSGPAATWISSDKNIAVSVNDLEVSNQAPSSTASCSADDVKAGDLWIGLSGGFSYTPDNVNLSATGCFDLTGKNATIGATGDLPFASDLPFTVTDAKVTAKIGGDGTYSLTGSADVTITQGVSGDHNFTVGLSLGNAGIIAGVQIKDLSTLDDRFSGSGALYVSTYAADGFDPGATFGFTGQPASIDLKAGLDVSLAFALPTTVVDDFQEIIPGFPGQTSVQAMATLSSSGFTVDAGLVLGTGAGTGGLPVASNSNTGTAFYLDRLDVGLALGDQNQVTLSGTGYLVLPRLASGEDASSLSVTVGGYFNITSLTLGLTFDVGGWDNDALGISGLSVQDFGGSFGLTLESGVPTPSLGIYANGLVLPSSWSHAIGVVQGTEISFDGNFSISQPVLSISFTGQNGEPALTPLAIDPNASDAEINSFTVNTAALVLAPFGGMAGTDTLTPGVSVIFDAHIAGVSGPVHVDAEVDLTAPSIYANVYVGGFSTGQVTVTGTTFYLAITPTYYSLYMSGGISDGDYSFSAGISLEFGSTAAGASVSLVVTGGLPSYLEGYAYLGGVVNGDGSISASGSGSLVAGGSTLGPVSFSLSLPGTLTWSDFSNSITQIIQFFQNAGTSASEIVSILEELGYSYYDILNSLGSLGDYNSGWLNDVASAFGFSTTYFDIVAQDGQVLDVTGGSQSPSTQVITYPVDYGYNQDWAFVPSPYSGWYNVVSRGSGQCLTVQYNTATPGNSLIQYPCNDGLNQLWYMGGSISTLYTYVMGDPFYSNGTEEVADIQSADVWPGAIVDQWTYNGGWNQEFTLANSTN